MAYLPETFHLPTGDDYDDFVAGIDDDIKQEGSTELFLGMFRYARRGNKSYYDHTLLPMASEALSLEHKKSLDPRDPDSRLTKDPKHRLANTLLSGMLFGDIMNQGFYPGLNTKHKPYGRFVVYDNMLGEHSDVYIAKGKKETVEGRRIGFRAMSNFILNQMGSKSMMKLDAWSQSLILNDELQPYFIQGVGMGLFMAWDGYSDLLLMDDRPDDVKLPKDLTLNNQ